MRKADCHNKKAVFIMCASLVLWTLGAYAIALPPGVGTPAGSGSVAERVGADGDDPNEPNEPTWAEMAEDTHFMVFIDVSDSMATNDIEIINEAAEMFKQYLSDEVYDGDREEACWHVIVEEVTSERYLQHMAAWNQNDPNATRYVNFFFTNEADQDYYTEDVVLYPTEHFINDLTGNQDSGGLIYGLRNELALRTFSIGKVFNVGGRQGNNLGGYHPAFAVHLYCAFNNVGGYADMNLGDLGISYDNIERGLAAVDILQYMVDTLDYSAACIHEEETEDCPDVG